MSRFAAFVGALVVALAVAPSAARADDETVSTYAIQNRAYPLKHELYAEFGVLPINAFDKGITIGAGYTYHFNTLWAWEVAQFHYAFDVETSLKQTLRDNFAVQPTQISSLNYFGTSSLVFKPFYGKLSLVNHYIVHIELFLALGGGFGKYQPGDFAGCFDVGGGLRFWGNRYFSARLDVREYGFIRGGGVTNELFIGLAAALTFGGDGATYRRYGAYAQR